MTSYVGAQDPDEADRLAAQAAGGREELRRALALHPPESAARVLELGCGAGAFTRTLLDALPDATIVATDSDERLLAAARQRLAAEARAGRVTFTRADARALAFPARSFGLVACRFLLMHLADPLVTVAEMYRVAAVGGVAIAIEPDWGARALYPDVEALDELMRIARQSRAYGFPDLLLGRKLFALLRAAGFAAVDVHASAFSETAADAVDSSTEQPSGPGRLLEQARALVRQSGAATDDELDALIARLDAVVRHPEYFSAGLDFAAAGLKRAPGESGEAAGQA
jgi:SAM-dependent methyltransferase